MEEDPDDCHLNGRNREYFKDRYTDVIAAFDMPYVEGYNLLTDVENKIAKDAENDPDAIITAFLHPATCKIFSLKTRFKTHNNAIKAAIEIYMIKVKTGKLPDSLPAGMPKDLYSDKSFLYEKTADSFILRCRTQDPLKNKLYEYEFKIPK